MFKKLGIKKGDIVNIKFKPVIDIVKSEKMTFKSADERYAISDNFVAFNIGGDFLVHKVNLNDVDDEHITVINHLDSNFSDQMYVYEEVVDSIQVVDDSENRFISPEHNLCVIRIDNDLVINGTRLVANEEAKKEEHDRLMRRQGKSDPYVNQAEKLLKLFEDFITDNAVNKSLKGEK